MVENQSAGALCTVEPYIFNDRYVKDRGEPTMKQLLRREEIRLRFTGFKAS